MSSARQSARLRAAAATVVDVAAAAVKTTATTARASKRTVSTTTSTAAAAARGTTMTASKAKKQRVATPPAADAAAAGSAAATDATDASDTTASTASAHADSKNAWSALFAKKSAASKAARVLPKPASPISAALQARVDEYAQFDGVAPRSAATATKIVAWNVNGLRAVLKKDESVHMRAYVAQEDPDVLCFSETKIDRDELQKVRIAILSLPHAAH